MITGITVSGFKRFEQGSFDFAPLTVLTGLNGAGKTSLLQAILLAAHASLSSARTLSLNGPFNLELGTAEDVLNWMWPSPIEVHAAGGGGKVAKWRFTIPNEEDLYLEVADRPETPLKAFSGVPRTFTYLSAERLGPRSVSLASPLPDAELEVGVKGEYCAHVLSVLGDRLIENPERSHPLYDAPSPRLLKYEVEQWLSEITRPIEVTGERMAASTVAELRFRTPGSDWVRATNMGFGISYALPIILAGLIAEPGGLLIVENPEAHLHPAGQSRMGVFLAWLAERGVQVLVETHSDHLVNGIRRGIAEHSYLEPINAVVHWFGAGESADEPFHETLVIGSDGSLSNWPSGFFDQYQIDVSALGRVRRGRR